MTISNRKFGIEIEAYNISITQAVHAIAAVGIDIRAEEYGHTRPRQWKVVTDGSVPGGFEVVSPVLQGEEGLEQIKKVCRALNDAGAKVDKRCGFHVHVDANGLTAADIKNVMERYGRFENEIDKFMPVSRRSNNNTYCKSVSGWLSRARSHFGSANTVDSVVRLMSERYYKINLQAYLRHGTIEFRQHSGTTNAEKTTNWVRFCINFVEQSIVRMETVRTTNDTANASMRASTQAKYARIIELLSQQGGATVEEIATATGYAANSVVAMISKIRTEMGYGVKKTRWNGKYKITRTPTSPASDTAPTQDALDRALARRGFAQAVQAEAAPVVRPVRVENDTWYSGLDRAIIAYYNERMSELSGS